MRIAIYESRFPEQSERPYRPLEAAKPGDPWIEVIQLTKTLCPDHSGELQPRLLFTVNGAPFGPQNFEEGDPKTIFLDSYFFAHDVFQHGWSCGLGYFNLANIGGELNSGHIEIPGSDIPCYLLKTSDIPSDALQQLSHIQRAVTHDEALGQERKNPSLELWNALELAQCLADPSIPEGSVLTISIGRPWPDRFFMEDPQSAANNEEHELLLEYENPFQTFIDHTMARRAEQAFDKLTSSKTQPCFSHEKADSLEIGFSLSSDSVPTLCTQLIGSIKKNGAHLSSAKFERSSYLREIGRTKEELTSRETYLIEKGLPERQIQNGPQQWVSIYQDPKEPDTAYLFFKEKEELTIHTNSMTRVRVSACTPLSDVLTGAPYKSSEILDIHLTTPETTPESKVRTESLHQTVARLVSTYTLNEKKEIFNDMR